jgi:hypothetical protein
MPARTTLLPMCAFADERRRMIEMTLRATLTVFCLLSVFAAPALADQATDAMKKAEALYRQGQLGKSYRQLEEAAAEIAYKLTGDYAKTYPPAPKGWSVPPYQRSKQRIRRGLGRGILLIRHYRERGGKGIATVQLIADDRGLVAALAIALRNPRAVKRMKGKWVPIKDVGRAVVTYSESRQRGDIRLLYAKRFYLTITARHIPNRDFLVNLLSAWDFAGLRKASGVD